MTSQPEEQLDLVPRHQVAVFADRLDRRLDELGDVPLGSMGAADQRATLTSLARARARLEALQLRLLAEADASGATTETGAATAATWVAAETRQTKRDARSDLKLAQRLEHLPALSAGMASGQVNTAQARAIVASLDRLPTRGSYAVSLEQRAAAEQHLVGLAADHDAKELALLGRRILEVVAPEVADEVEGRLLEQQEAIALRRTTFTMWEDEEGTCHGRFRIPALHGHMLGKALQSLTNPTRHREVGAVETEVDAGSGIDPDLPTPVRNGIAFSQLLEAIEAHWLPSSGGCGATVVVTMTLDQLIADLEAAGVCMLDTGGRISASEARRLACRAGLVPLVLGGKSVVLDAGTRSRFHTEPMRTAMGVRDRGCTAEDCDVPASMCHAHHDVPFSEGGATSVANGRLLCGHHHRRIHDPAFRHSRRPDGRVAFHRRT